MRHKSRTWVSVGPEVSIIVLSDDFVETTTLGVEASETESLTFCLSFLIDTFPSFSDFEHENFFSQHHPVLETVFAERVTRLKVDLVIVILLFD